MTNKRDVEVALADHKQKLNFEGESDCVIIKKPYDATPRGKEEWDQIMTIVRTELNGKWVSLGRDSHWIVPLEPEKIVEKREVSGVEKRKADPPNFVLSRLIGIRDEVERLIEELEKGASQTD